MFKVPENKVPDKFTIVRHCKCGGACQKISKIQVGRTVFEILHPFADLNNYLKNGFGYVSFIPPDTGPKHWTAYSSGGIQGGIHLDEKHTLELIIPSSDENTEKWSAWLFAYVHWTNAGKFVPGTFLNYFGQRKSCDQKSC
jgi:hypothetical protein